MPSGRYCCLTKGVRATSSFHSIQKEGKTGRGEITLSTLELFIQVQWGVRGSSVFWPESSRFQSYHYLTDTMVPLQSISELSQLLLGKGIQSFVVVCEYPFDPSPAHLPPWGDDLRLRDLQAGSLWSLVYVFAVA